MAIEMKCKNYKKLSIIKPDMCYNCVNQCGYPQDLAGDDNCENFEPFGDIRPQEFVVNEIRALLEDLKIKACVIGDDAIHANVWVCVTSDGMERALELAEFTKQHMGG